MATANPGKAGSKGRPVKNPKKEKEVGEEDDDYLDDLVVEEYPDVGKPKTQSRYSNLEPSRFVMKGTDHKSRLDQRHARIAEAVGRRDDNDDEDEEETKKDKLECEARELSSQLKRAEHSEVQVRDKEEREKAKRFSRQIAEGRYLKQPKAVMLIPKRKRKKTLKMETIKSAAEEDEEDMIPEGFHLQEESLHCLNMQWAKD